MKRLGDSEILQFLTLKIASPSLLVLSLVLSFVFPRSPSLLCLLPPSLPPSLPNALPPSNALPPPHSPG